MMKRVLSVVLAIALLAIAIPMQAVTVSAASNIVINGVDIGYADGSYFTKNGKACTCHDDNSVNCVKTPSGCNCMRYWPTGSDSTDQVDLAAVQCFGYARYCQWKVYGCYDGQAPSKFSNITGAISKDNSTVSVLKSKLLGCAPATHLRMNKTHSISIISATEAGVSYTDCNIIGACQIRLETLSWTDFAKFVANRNGVEYAYAWKTPVKHDVDNNYAKNITAYPKAKITAENIMDASHSPINNTSWIGTSDLCTIHEVYTDGCCRVTYPLDNGGTKTAYSYISLFNVNTAPHTCNKGQYMYYESAHPHYSCYKCSTCGEIWRNTAETNKVAGCTSCDSASCTCSTSYAGTYTTKDVSSSLNIRDTHSTNGNVVGAIPANATFSVSKANGSWAHVSYNGISGYVSMEYIQKSTPNTIDTRYPTPFKAYTLQNADQPAYDGVNGNQIGRMFSTDHVTIEAVYTNGWVKATCPWQGYANGRTIYAPLSTFLNTSFTPKTIQVTTKTQCYYRSDLVPTDVPIYVYAGDNCVQVGESGDYVCVLCPWSNGSCYLVWAHKSAFAHTHSYGNWSKYDGSYHSRSCSCGNVEKQAHAWNSGTVTKQATCTSSGVKTYTCTVCSATKTETIPVKDHTWDNGTVTVAATCGSNGVRTYKCSGCSGTYTQEIPATGAHKYDNDCDESCNVCGDLRALLGHAYEGSVTIAATCGADGVCTYTCTSCGDSYTESIPATGEHKYDNDCDDTCNLCGAERTVGAHSYKSSVTTAATCGAAGVRTYTCSDCGHSYAESIPATGEHKYDNDLDADCNVCGAVREVLDENAPAFVVDSVNAFAGQTFTVAVRTERNSGIVSLKLNLLYDSEILELVSYEEQDFAGMSYSPDESNPFVFNWVDALKPNNTTNGVVLLFTFRVKDDAPAGETNLTLSYDADDVYDEEFNNVAFTIVNGTVTIRDFVPGDVTGDGKVNNKDLGQLQRYLNGWTVSMNEQAADVTGDGKVNNKDLGQLQRYLNGWNVELG